MFVYYAKLALRSLKRNVVLTSLMIAAIGVGIGASMTVLTIFRAMDGDPIPQKSTKLFTPQIDNWGPGNKRVVTGDREGFQDQITYRDAIGLMNAHAGVRQAAMYAGGMPLTPPNRDLLPFRVQTRATYTDFFSMFEVPFLYGSAWSTADDQDRSFVVVISRDLNDQVFHGANSVGKTLNFDNRDYRVVGVIDSWLPLPRYYDLIGNKLGKSEQAFIPMTRAIENEMDNQGTTNCAGRAEEIESWAARLTSECVWVQFWVELPTAADETRYRAFLNNYAAEQQRTGRFHWGPRTKLHDVRQWLVYMHVVSDEIRILVLVSFSFLFVCLLNAMGLMLAKIMSRAGDIGVRRALGASRAAIFQQCLIESGVVGLAGGILGIALTLLSLRGVRALVSDSVGRVSHLHMADVAIAVGLSVAAAILAGLYPTWRAAQVQPAWQLKTQ